MFNKLLSFTKKVADLDNKPALTPTELKNQFDAAPDEVRVYFNQLIDDLASIGLNGTVQNFGDLNLLTKTGFYYSGTGGTNRPGGNGWVTVKTLDGQNITQQFVDAFDGTVYNRICSSGTWQAWKQLTN
jgi:hypothetical protein